MNVDCFDDLGNSITDEQGELVCKSPFPSMPIYFWNDEKGEKYHNAYFDVYPNIWHHGDFIEITENGGREHINALSMKYTGIEDFSGSPDEIRVIYKINIQSVTTKG